MLGKKRPSRPKSGHSGLARTPAAAPIKGADGTALTIGRLAHDGRGIAHDAAGKTVFVEQALPGETVEAAVHTQRKRFDEAHIKALLTRSENRVTPPCPYFERCGGCDLQHLALPAQREHKRQVVKELFARQGMTLSEITPLDGDTEHYRRRARLGVRVDGQENVLLGFRAAGSHRLVNIAHCHVLVAELSSLIAPLKGLLDTLSAPRQVGHLELIKPAGAPVVLVRQLKANAQDAAAWRAFAFEQGVSVGAFVGRENATLEWYGEAPALEDELYLDPDGVEQEPPPNVTLGFEPGDFLQVNQQVNQRMVNQVLEWLTPTLASSPAPRVLDLFAGIGNFSVPLALKGANVHAVEGSQTMVARIEQNAARHGLDIAALQADLSREASVAALFEDDQGVDAVVLDPPRDGAEAICRALGRYRVPRVVYISCDPATLARDAAHLLSQGYREAAVALADMFVHTAHVETMVLFEYRG
ncbi:methyltransferase domain-containing protein [Halomonas sp. PAMB 3232]|uniref:methyltransferase domain-containing protein n=1 Tax=Halomonas sp. PAMB 3232 TaxID=3075221 RepID=UPI0028A1DF2A|nr:methyltransferase domain-containing protein [Halomonas sp. PAMB 3232]WNL37471.1 methyltransferase domain-containing protein [Halomonas sp. PAMB 3232]